MMEELLLLEETYFLHEDELMCLRPLDCMFGEEMCGLEKHTEKEMINAIHALEAKFKKWNFLHEDELMCLRPLDCMFGEEMCGLEKHTEKEMINAIHALEAKFEKWNFLREPELMYYPVLDCMMFGEEICRLKKDTEEEIVKACFEILGIRYEDRENRLKCGAMLMEECRQEEDRRRKREEMRSLVGANFTYPEFHYLRTYDYEILRMEQRLEKEKGEREMIEAMCALEAQLKRMSFHRRCRTSCSGKWDSRMFGEERGGGMLMEVILEFETEMEKVGTQRFTNMDHILAYPEKIFEQIESTGRDGFDWNFSIFNSSRCVRLIPAFGNEDVQVHTFVKYSERLRTPYVMNRWNGNKKSLIQYDGSIAVDMFWSGTLDTSELLRFIVDLSIQEGNPFEYKYFGRNPMETENDENGQNPEIRNAVINDKAGPTELEMFTAESYRQSEQLRRENDKQILEIEEALRRILHHLDVQPKVEKRRRCHASA